MNKTAHEPTTTRPELKTSPQLLPRFEWKSAEAPPEELVKPMEPRERLESLATWTEKIRQELLAG